MKKIVECQVWAFRYYFKPERDFLTSKSKIAMPNVLTPTKRSIREMDKIRAGNLDYLMYEIGWTSCQGRRGRAHWEWLH